MSNPSDKKISVSGGFCLLVLWFGMINGWKLLAAVLSAAAVHELGHWFVLKLLGGRGTALRVSVFGAEMRVAGRLSYGEELAVVLAGPGVNILCGIILALFEEPWMICAGVHLVLGCFNLLPIRPLDGGRALFLVGSWGAGPAVGERLVRIVGGCTALTGAVFLLWLMCRSGGSLWLFPAMTGMLIGWGNEVCGKRDFL